MCQPGVLFSDGKLAHHFQPLHVKSKIVSPIASQHDAKTSNRTFLENAAKVFKEPILTDAAAANIYDKRRDAKEKTGPSYLDWVWLIRDNRFALI